MRNAYLRGMVAEKCRLAQSLIAEIRSSWEVSATEHREALQAAAAALQQIEHDLRRDPAPREEE